MLGTSDAWLMSCLSHRPSKLILKILGFMERQPNSSQYPLINYLDTASDLVPNEDSAVNLQLQPPNTTSTDSSTTETLASTTSAAAANEVGPISDIQK